MDQPSGEENDTPGCLRIGDRVPGRCLGTPRSDARRAVVSGTGTHRGCSLNANGRCLKVVDTFRTASRASVAGFPVLYCSDSEGTAVSEAKPSRGLLISVARVRMRREARVLNTVDPVERPNPFAQESLDYWLAFIELLESFGEELGRPLERRDDPAGYLPCQKLAKAVRASGFDGIRYPSAMTVGGVNVVLFDPTVAEILGSKLVRVIRVTVEHGDADSVTCETRAPFSFDSF
nr:RES family NAD+ phosphorylase [Nitrospirota bacterium]